MLPQVATIFNFEKGVAVRSSRWSLIESHFVSVMNDTNTAGRRKRMHRFSYTQSGSGCAVFMVIFFPRITVSKVEASVAWLSAI